MESSHLPFHYWFYTKYLIVMLKKIVSALVIQHQIGHKRESTLYLMHKIRTVIGVKK